MDDRGYLWIFSSSHGTGRPSYIHRSTKPWSIDEFERVLVTNFSYTQPWYVPGEGFLFLHTRYGGGKARGIDAARCLFWMTSADGTKWSRAANARRHRRWAITRSVGARANASPPPSISTRSPVGLNARANIYYLETDDFGRTWRNVARRAGETAADQNQ